MRGSRGGHADLGLQWHVKAVAGRVMNVLDKELYLRQIILDSKNQNLGMAGVSWQT